MLQTPLCNSWSKTKLLAKLSPTTKRIELKRLDFNYITLISKGVAGRTEREVSPHFQFFQQPKWSQCLIDDISSFESPLVYIPTMNSSELFVDLTHESNSGSPMKKSIQSQVFKNKESLVSAQSCPAISEIKHNGNPDMSTGKSLWILISTVY